jgi:hypothetical protein
VKEGQTVQNGAAVDAAVVVDDGGLGALAAEDGVGVTGDATVAHADGAEEVVAGFVDAAGVASGPVAGLDAGAEFDIAAQRELDRLGTES